MAAHPINIAVLDCSVLPWIDGFEIVKQVRNDLILVESEEDSYSVPE